MLMAAGVGIGIHTYEHLLGILAGTEPTIVDPLALSVVLASILTKELLFRKTMEVGVRAKSQILIANAWHHRSDALSSIVAFVGVGGSLLGIPLADPISGLFVTGMVIKVAADVGWACVKDLVDLNVGDTTDKVAQITSSLQSPDGEIRSIHAIRARKLGPRVSVDLHIQVDPLLSVSGSHQAGQMVRAAIMKALPEVDEVLLHIDVDEHSNPMDGTTPLRPINSIRADVKTPPLNLAVYLKHTEKLMHLFFQFPKVRKSLETVTGIKGVSHVLVHYLQQRVLVEVQIHVEDDISIRQAREIGAEAKRVVESIKDVTEAHVDLELTDEHKFTSLRENNHGHEKK